MNGNQKQIFTLDSAATVKAVRITNLAQTSKWWKVYDLSATKIDEPGTVTKDALNAKVAEAEKVDSADWTKSSRGLSPTRLPPPRPSLPTRTPRRPRSTPPSPRSNRR